MTTTAKLPAGLEVLDVIDHRHRYGVQRELVVSRLPKPLFERRGQLLIGEDCGVFQFYGYEQPGPTWKAFGGRKFEIPMADGTTIKANGQWWDPSIPADYRDLLYSFGLNTEEKLGECHVFFGQFCIDREIVDAWLEANEPSNNYHKYDRRHRDYRQQTIESRWAP